MDNIRDPDYEITNVAKEQLRIREETEKNQCVDRIKTIIKQEFQREFEFREKQLELIQKRITKAAKTLHLLRYCLVTSYYNRNELQLNAGAHELPIFDRQSRIHPAVKKLLGNNSLEIHTPLGSRKKRKTFKAKANMVIQESNETTLKKEIVEENEISTDSPVESIKNETTIDDYGITVRNRKLYKHQIVVGNISKWAPSESPDDNSTHKWMVYVRGPKEYPDISHIIQKVVFFLHPSYKPNDVIEICKSPFHLSRRGWGEFPLRIQLYFHGKMNKPVDIIHNLKLDKTYTGRQTLGNEMVVELSLYDLKKCNNSKSLAIPNTTTDNLKIKVETEDYELPAQEATNDESHLEPMDIKVDIESPIVSYINLDHSYCQSDSAKSSKIKFTEVKSEDTNKVCTKDNAALDNAILNVKKRRPQQSLLKISMLKRVKTENVEEQSMEM